jgi:hypothetical protein
MSQRVERRILSVEVRLLIARKSLETTQILEPSPCCEVEILLSEGIFAGATCSHQKTSSITRVIFTDLNVLPY